MRRRRKLWEFYLVYLFYVLGLDLLPAHLPDKSRLSW
jgi:hypothetical protein